MTEAEGIVGEYVALKREADADLLAMQVGDFYEFFDEDAQTVGRELDLKVSQKGSAGDSYPMAGVPVDDLTPYVRALVERGYRVAVADQHETSDGHAREVTRIATPGTLLETTDADAQYLAAVVRDGDAWGLAFADVTTGRFVVADVEGGPDAVLSELYRFSPAEILPGPDVRNDDAFLERVRERTDATLSLHESRAFEPGRAERTAREQFGRSIETVGLDARSPAVRAAGGVLSYVEGTNTGVLASMTRLQPYRGEDHVELDATTQRNLELVESMTGEGQTLLETIDHTVTSPGGRLLAEWLTRPRRSQALLEERLDSVAALSADAMNRERIRDVLGDAYDLERLAARATGGSAGPRELLSVRDTLAILPDLAEIVGLAPVEPGDAAPGDGDDGSTGDANSAGGRSRLADSPLPGILDDPDREAAARLRATLDEALAADPASSPSEGGVIARGYDEDLDDLIDRHEQLEEYFDSLADRESKKTGLTHLSVGRNKTDGYYIQVGKSEADQVPDRYEAIKTLKNSERFTTDELERKERAILRLEEQRGERERELFEDLVAQVAGHAELLQDAGRALAQVDVLASLATHAVQYDWVRPELGGDATDVVAGRHPVVETTTDFVPNDVRLDDERRFVIVTGPNMSGKSTYMRQTALIHLLAQVGSFVPADSARISMVDGIFTRVGALDELAGGRSTFMVEMEELSNILHSATEDSLVILDEVGRGTATFDGISIAWAATEYLHNEIRARTMFATHYHELTTLANELDRVANVHVAADETDGEVTFLRTVREGPTDRSYGIHVADLAGVPDPVVDRSRDVLDRLRNEKAVEVRGSGTETQQVVFDVNSGELKPASATDGGGTGGESGPDADSAPESDGEPAVDPDVEAVVDELAAVDLAETSPVELMAKVQEWQAQIDDEE